MGSNPIGHPSSNPLQLCVVRDFFVYLPPPPLTPCCPPAQPRCDKPPVTVRSRHVSFLVSRPCCRRGACRTVALDRKVPLAYLPARTRAPMPVAAGKRFSPLHRRMRSGANRLLGWGSDAPAPMRFSKRLSGVVETYISSRAGARAHTAFFVFCLHPSPACVRRSKSGRCGECKGEGQCSPLPSLLCGSRLNCCGFWHEGWHVFDQSPLIFPHFRVVFPVRVE